MIHARRHSLSLHLLLRECAVALAVLSIWLLSLLAPLHQSSNLLRELARAGIDTGGAWTLCIASDIASDADGSIQICPAQGIGNTDPEGPGLPRLAALVPHHPGEALRPAYHLQPDAAPSLSPWQARAPPVVI